MVPQHEKTRNADERPNGGPTALILHGSELLRSAEDDQNTAQGGTKTFNDSHDTLQSDGIDKLECTSNSALALLVKA